MNYNVMNRNYEAAQVMMDGVNVLRSMLDELTESVTTLPNCCKTAAVKKLSAQISTDSEYVCEMLQKIADEVWETNEFAEYSEDDYYPDNPCSDIYDDKIHRCKATFDVSEINLKPFIDMIDELFADGKITVSADIYINKDKDNKDNDAESEDK